MKVTLDAASTNKHSITVRHPPNKKVILAPGDTLHLTIDKLDDLRIADQRAEDTLLITYEA